jgi:hypothetical protein
MSHRPYPSADRARRQLARHGHTPPELVPLERAAQAALFAASQAVGPLLEGARQALTAQPTRLGGISLAEAAANIQANAARVFASAGWLSAAGARDDR